MKSIKWLFLFTCLVILTGLALPSPIIDLSPFMIVKNDEGQGSAVSTNFGILTCKHMVIDSSLPIEKPIINSEATTNNDYVFQLHTLRTSQKYDLALLSPVDPRVTIPEITISNQSPELGEGLWLIGSGSGMQNAVRRGHLSKIYTDEFLLDARIFPGDSGGGVICNDKLVGIMNKYYINNGNPTYSACVSTSAIWDFLLNEH